jgi:hypothetical protein
MLLNLKCVTHSLLVLSPNGLEVTVHLLTVGLLLLCTYHFLLTDAEKL